MKKLLIFLILSILFLSGCGIYDMNTFVLPNDTEFIALVEELDTPEKVCQYMEDNFTYQAHPYKGFDPYVIWKTGKADCNDFSTFAQFVSNYHGYETYSILTKFDNITHSLGVYLENGKYNYSNCAHYHSLNALSFEEIVVYNFRYPCETIIESYEVYDYKMNLVEKVQM